MHAQTQEVMDIKSSSREALLALSPQTSGVRESRVRGGVSGHVAKLSLRRSLAAVAVCGGVQKRNLAARAGCEAWADSPAMGMPCPWVRSQCRARLEQSSRDLRHSASPPHVVAAEISVNAVTRRAFAPPDTGTARAGAVPLACNSRT